MRSSIRVQFEAVRPRTSCSDSRGDASLSRIGVENGRWPRRTKGVTLLFHFGMTGSLVWDVPEGGSLRFERVIVWVGAGKLVFRDQRKLHGLWLAEDEAGVRAVIGEQGPDGAQYPAFGGTTGWSSRSAEVGSRY